MCFAPQPCTFSTSHLPKVLRTWCALAILTSKCASRHNGVHFFEHLNFQKCSDVVVFLAFRLGNVLRATAARNFSSLIWPEGSAPSAVASLLFAPPEPRQITVEKHIVLRLFYLFAHLHLLSSHSFSSLIFFLLLLSSLR